VLNRTVRCVQWWLPSDIVFVPELPHTATGKLLKTTLRVDYATHLTGGATAPAGTAAAPAPVTAAPK
jgi:acyl-CoA synthetase (AMP-forming)/AMP-acid ligase II